MKKIVFLFVSVLLFTFSQSYGQKTYKVKDLKITKGLVFYAQQDGIFNSFTFLVKKSKKSEKFISSVKIQGLPGDILSSAHIYRFGNMELYVFDISLLKLRTDFKVEIEIGSGIGMMSTRGFDIPGDGDGGPGGPPPPTTIIIKYP
ncbi:MAG: hypothetical protein J7L96_05460 [Bacteroidales bacterium]|nr:hypothetical protein [Bacteroidales bacterium]